MTGIPQASPSSVKWAENPAAALGGIRHFALVMDGMLCKGVALFPDARGLPLDFSIRDP